MAYRIKQVPGDFMVREILEPELGSGRYAYYRLTKRGWTTQSAVSQIARAFRKRPKFINFSGNKDKQAVTEQYLSILHGPRKSLELHGGEISLEYLGQSRERLNLGTAPGNHFEIVVRNLPRGFKTSATEQVPNYFDEQRFGMNMNNHLIGKLIIQKRFDEACRLIPETGEWLRKSPRDYVGALRSLPKRVLRIYPHSYQSWLWNATASRYLSAYKNRKVSWPLGELIIPTENVKNTHIPILGYDSLIPRGLLKTINEKLESEGISLEDFRPRQFREFDLAGNSRDLMVTPEGIEICRLEDDELNPGKKRCLVRFYLQSGSYATMVIRAIFS